MPHLTLAELPPDTEEQALITGYQGRRLVVKAFAGTGKTSTLVKYALRHPHERILYLAYNRAIRDEAVSKFPPNVECKTSHQLAFAAVGRLYTHKLSNNLRLTDINATLSHGNWSLAREVLQTLNAFLSSDDQRLADWHCDHDEDSAKPVIYSRQRRGRMLDAAQVVWDKMVDKEDPFPMTHDGYLKLYQLGRPNLSQKYQTVMFDEAQDANPVTSSLVLSQRCKVIYVGDDHQQIYRFRGANNAMNSDSLKHADILHLTHSFRFGRNIAMVANCLLLMKKEKRPVIGRGKEDRVCQTFPPETGQHAILNRTVMGVIETALLYSLEGKKVYWVGGINAYQLTDLEDLHWLSLGQKQQIRSARLLKDFDSFDEYEKVAKDTREPEMNRSLKLLEKYHGCLPKLIALMHQQAVPREQDADVIVSTAHRCKGLEWPTVLLGGDFPDLFDPELPARARNDEINLLYVACTRALNTLIINDIVSMVMRYAKAIANKSATAAQS